MRPHTPGVGTPVRTGSLFFCIGELDAQSLSRGEPGGGARRNFHDIWARASRSGGESGVWSAFWGSGLRGWLAASVFPQQESPADSDNGGRRSAKDP